MYTILQHLKNSNKQNTFLYRKKLFLDYKIKSTILTIELFQKLLLENYE